MSKLGRNELCYCGSGKKYKKCCLEVDNGKKKVEVLEERGGKTDLVGFINEQVQKQLGGNFEFKLQ